jgi:hypothetical protein
MSPDEYRLNARRCLDLSKQLPAGHTSRGFLDMAAGWLRLAEQAEKKQTTNLDKE